jgi:hypothetical protein
MLDRLWGQSVPYCVFRVIYVLRFIYIMSYVIRVIYVTSYVIRFIYIICVIVVISQSFVSSMSYVFCHLCHMFSDLDRIAKREPWTKRMKLTWQLHVTWGIGLGSYSCCLGHAAGQCSVPNYMASFFSKLCFPLNLKPRMTILTPKLLNLKTHQHNAIFSHGIY